ncbi:energy-coupling factor transporter transmembrane protein EcfT [Pseudoclavibacter endophyticus]|uniref:Energy-coupling factor transporter transmembrane protein EcfT n=1 Tax=Pseudoclavibacter endophyticus TaxID=1778590 RepID=A0A6H9WJX1_9MICO|nr:energy-coupling factor transporter transmembrane component T [Pseudoclavibacter endophyticus]KAB1646956.1 energy-coupling factor transporter transmembrane protein EcfT [Pseudoclavibacter endophyticus]
MGGANPVAKLGAALFLAAVLLLSIDWVSATIALALELVLFCFAGLTLRRFFLRTWPVLVAAPLTGVTTLLYGRASGEMHLQWGLVQISDGSIDLAIATCIRVLAIALPAVVLFITIDPTDLADGLAQVVRLPHRFVIGALAAFRLVGLFVDDWRAMSLARRARGLGDQHVLRRFLGMGFAMLVLSIRRGTKLATAMEARGFGALPHRTWARESRFGRRDAALVVAVCLIAIAAIVTSVATGNWNFIIGGGRESVTA